MLRTALLLLLTTLFFAACKKNDTAKKTTCTSTLYGNKYAHSPDPFPFGVINQSTASLAPVAFNDMLIGNVCDDRGAYNLSDNCFYGFMHAGYSVGTGMPLVYNDTLVRINNAGIITKLSNSSGSPMTYRNVIYDQLTNKLYCIKEYQLSEIIITGTTFTTAPVLTDSIGPVSIANSAAGDIFYTGINATAGYIRKYHPGSSTALTVATSATLLGVFGLCYNENDHQLYAIKENPGSNYDFIKVDPTSGSVNTITPLGFTINPQMYSAIIDPCSNLYLLSSEDGAGSPLDSTYLKQINMSGAVVQSNMIPDGLYTQLTIH